jgi:pimeloyl-ACP methyl ester carboxylesterase
MDGALAVTPLPRDGVCEAEQVEFEGHGVRLMADRWRVEKSAGTVILLHGGGQTRYSWHGTGPSVAAAGWDCLSLDQRGHGESDWAPDADYGLAAMEADLCAVIEQLGGPAPVLVGASMGGLVSLLSTANRPGIARALVLVDIVPRIGSAGAERIREFMQARPDGFGSLEEVAAAVYAYNPHRSRPPTLEGLRKNVRLRDGRWFWHWDPARLQGGSQLSRFGGSERLSAAARTITVPTLLIRGKQSDIVSDEGVKELLELIPGSRAVDIAGAGHMVAGDDNDVFADALLDFLAESRGLGVQGEQ